MSQRYIGSSISPTAAPTSSTSTTGVWSINDQYQAKNANNWPMYVPPATTDPYFQYVSMLLPANGTNGAQNNTFLDSSTNNFTITRTGNTTQGTFTPYGANWSNYFDGTGDYLSAATNTAFNFSTGDFTIEAWVYPNSLASDWFITSASGSGGLFFGFASSSTIGFGWGRTGVAWDYRVAGSATANTWQHVAITRSGTSMRLFVNGVQQGTTQTNSTAYDLSTTSLTIGSQGSNYYLNGFISNLRVVKGQALYTSAFTPSTTPLQSVANTSLLTCQSNRFVDNSANNFAITRNGDTSVQRFSPFSPTAPYSAATIGGSAYFDGTSDYLSVAGSSAYGTLPANGSFTIEGWFYFQDVTIAQQTIFTQRTSAAQYCPYLIWTSTSNILLYSSSNNSSWDIVNGATIATGLVSGQWYHFAYTRNGSTFKFFVNGVQTYTYTSAAAFSNTNSFNLGMSPGEINSAFKGYCSNVRFVNGTAVYTSAFAPPPAPVTAITNTSLLINATNAGIIDNAEMNDLETVGNAQISTTQSKFGGSSMYFDGNSDSLITPNSPNINFYAGDFTIECWAYFNNISSEMVLVNKGWQSANAYASYLIFMTSSGVLKFGSSSSGGSWDIANDKTIATMVANTWTHIAITRSGTTFRAFINGELISAFTFTSSSSLAALATQALYIGGRVGNTSSMNGYIDDLRLTKGYARYAATFTPPTAAFPTA